MERSLLCRRDIRRHFHIPCAENEWIVPNFYWPTRQWITGRIGHGNTGRRFREHNNHRIGTWLWFTRARPTIHQTFEEAGVCQLQCTIKQYHSFNAREANCWGNDKFARRILIAVSTLKIINDFTYFTGYFCYNFEIEMSWIQ